MNQIDINEEDSTVLKCFLNKKHLICTDAVKFPCRTELNKDLYACSRCIRKKLDFTCSLHCDNCQSVHRFYLNSITKDEEYAMLAEKNAQTIAMQLLNQSDSIINNIKTNVFENQEPLNCLNTLFEHIEYEIDFRVESLKNEMQLLRCKLFQSIDKYKEATINKVTNERQVHLNTLLTHADKSNIHLFEKKCIKLVNQTSHIEHTSKILERSNQKQTRNPNLGSVTMLGFLNSQYNQFNLKSINSLKNSNTKLAFIDLKVKSVCGLHEIYFFKSFKKSFELVITDFATNEIRFMNKFDSYLTSDTHTQSMSSLNNFKFKNYYSLSSNSLDDYQEDYDDQSLFVTDLELQRVLVFDLKATKLKKIIQGKTNLKREFECPRDVCYSNNRIYVLDQGTNSIDIFHQHDGTHVKSFLFNRDKHLIQMAWSVRVSPQFICVIDWLTKIFVFDHDENLLGSIDQLGITSMCFVNDNYFNLQLLFLHSTNGDFIGYSLKRNKQDFVSDLIYKNSFDELRSASEFMIYSTSQMFLLALGWSKKIAVINIK